MLGDAEIIQTLTTSDAKLRQHQVDPGDFLGDGVFDLNARVHLDERVPVPVNVNFSLALRIRPHEVLDCAGSAVLHFLGKAHRICAQAVDEGSRKSGSGGNLYNLLVSSLHRAVTLVEVNDAALAIGEDLHLDVPRAYHRLLDEKGVVAKCCGSLTAG